MISSFVITGFLGAGKTSMMLNTVQENFKDKKVAVIVNEFGDTGIDGNVLKNVYSDVIEISEGCICCELVGEFESGIREVVEKYKPEMLFVETSGVTEPFPVFITIQSLGISVEGVICVIDSKNFDTYKNNETTNAQIGGSNIIVLNKTDLVTKEELSSLKNEIISLKEEHDLKNIYTNEKVFNNYIIYESEQGIVSNDVFEGVYKVNDIEMLAQKYMQDKNTHTHDHKHEHLREDGIMQKVGHFTKNVKFDDIDMILKELPKNIYRVKGVIKVDDIPTPLFVNYSFGNVTFDEADDYKEEPLLIFIGKNIDDDVQKISEEVDFLTFSTLENSDS